MKDIIVTVGLILLGVVVFTLIMGAGSGSLLTQTQAFFSNMGDKFSSIGSAGSTFG